MSKKSQGLSINAIILVAIALIVLVVLIAVFTGRMGIFTGGLQQSTTCNDVCKAAGYASGAQTDTTSSQTAGLKDSNNNACACASTTTPTISPATTT